VPHSLDVLRDNINISRSWNGNLHEHPILGKPLFFFFQQPKLILLFQRIETLYGVTELASWLVRILVNVIQLILIQSLYTSWKDEELVEKRLQDLNMTAIPIPRESLQSLNSQYYQNNAYDNSSEELNMTLKRYHNK
jgi:hypothetical protein